MQYLSTDTGQAFPAHIAAFADGKPKPGFRAVLDNGERANFDMMFMDAAPRRPAAYVTDSRQQVTDAEIAAAYDAMVEDLHRPKRPDNAPPPVADTDPAAAYDAMIADLTRSSR